MTNFAMWMPTSYGLLKFRILVNVLSFAHLVIVSIRLLSKDFDQFDDETIQVYAKFKWKLITTWFNLLYYVYLPVCLYCDWRALKGGDSKHEKMAKKFRDFTFTNLMMPTTAFADILFWRLWYHDKALLMPLSMESVILEWEHHCMHTVSLAFAIFDLLTVRRERPKSMVPGILAMLTFVSLYITICVHSIINEEYIYPIFKKFSPYKLLVLVVYTYTSFLFYHTGQWLVIDLIHGQKSILKKNV